ncbi:protein of unknown function [Streptomyces murinus]
MDPCRRGVLDRGLRRDQQRDGRGRRDSPELIGLPAAARGKAPGGSRSLEVTPLMSAPLSATGGRT